MYGFSIRISKGIISKYELQFDSLLASLLYRNVQTIDPATDEAIMIASAAMLAVLIRSWYLSICLPSS